MESIINSFEIIASKYKLSLKDRSAAHKRRVLLYQSNVL